jgi:hypothetical protein
MLCSVQPGICSLDVAQDPLPGASAVSGSRSTQHLAKAPGRACPCTTVWRLGSGAPCGALRCAFVCARAFVGRAMCLFGEILRTFRPSVARAVNWRAVAMVRWVLGDFFSVRARCGHYSWVNVYVG